MRDPRTLRPLRSYPGFGWAGALSPDGRTFAFGSADGSVRFIDLRTGEQRTGLGRHTAAVDRLMFTPDGRFLVTAGEDSNVIVWDVEAAEAGETLEGHTGRVAGLTLDRRGRALFTAAADGTVITWDLVGRPAPRPALRRRQRLRLLAVDGDQPRRPHARHGQRRRGRERRRHANAARHRLPIANGPPPGNPSAPAFGPPGTLIVSSFDGYLARVDARTGRVTGRFTGHRDSPLHADHQRGRPDRGHRRV